MKLIKLKSTNSPRIFCDMDGVLAFFDKGASKLFPKRWKRLIVQNPALFWKTVTEKGTEFWSELSWMPGGKKLWNFIKEYNPTILSSHPREKYTCEQGKKIWLKKHLGKKFAKRAIICLKAKKPSYAKSGYILIDDNKVTIKNWKKAGGIGILHKKSEDTIKILRKHLENP